MEYRELKTEEIGIELFGKFERHQNVTKCLRKIGGDWVIKDVLFVDQWSDEEYIELVKYLRNTLNTNGVVYGAFEEGVLKGFNSVESKLFGFNYEYLDLSCIHVSEDARGHGIGNELFCLAAEWAKAHGACKLYISAHSAVETQAFYKSMGCVEAEEYNLEHVEKEPYDCQLEYVLQ